MEKLQEQYKELQHTHFLAAFALLFSFRIYIHMCLYIHFYFLLNHFEQTGCPHYPRISKYDSLDKQHQLLYHLGTC